MGIIAIPGKADRNNIHAAMKTAIVFISVKTEVPSNSFIFPYFLISKSYKLNTLNYKYGLCR
jgi:hypothetical protein